MITLGLAPGGRLWCAWVAGWHRCADSERPGAGSRACSPAATSPSSALPPSRLRGNFPY